MSDDTVFERLMTASRESHRARLHEVAYHALMAAMHAAYAAGDGGRLEEVAHEGEVQIAWIDEHATDHRLSTRSAGRHDHLGVYRLLVRQAEMYRTMTKRELRQRQPRA